MRLARGAALAVALILAWTAAPAVAAPASVSGAGTSTRVAATRSPAIASEKATEIARGSARLGRWLDDHPAKRTSASRDAARGEWTVAFIDAHDKIQAQVLVDDTTGTIRETRTGPQVAWQMARGYKGAFGRSITEPQIWIPLLLAFVLPLLSLRRLFSWRTLDLLMLVGFSVSLVWFNRGEIFTSVPLVYPPLVYLAIRLAVVGIRGRRAAPRTPPAEPETAAPANTPGQGSRRPRLDSWCPTWLLLCLLLLALGLRLGLNAFDANVIDVGYGGVIGADRITHGETPYGTFPADCGQCDTYGPVTYLAYVPFEAAMPWVGRWNDLPAAHGAAVLFDLLSLLGMLVLGWRLGGARLSLGLGLAWTAFPFTAYALESNSNDSLVAACLVWGLVFAHRPLGRGVALGLAVLSKFSPAILLPLWSRHPFPRSGPSIRRLTAYVGGLAIAAVATGWVVMLDGWDGPRAFWSRTVGFQLDRESPFSIWGQHDWLRPVQVALAGIVVVGAIVAAVRPRYLDLRAFAALSGALLLGIQLTMTHWFYLYIPWFLPFALVALVPEWPRERLDPSLAPQTPEPQVTPAPAGSVA